MPATYTVKQVADILGYSTNSIYTFLKEKRIKGVRVGRGRFRVPQSELNRLLLSSGKEQAPVSQMQQYEHHHEHERFDDERFIRREERSATDENPVMAFRVAAATGGVEVPNLFDWFTGLSAIILGIAMELFRGTFEEFTLMTGASWIGAIKISLVAAGAGLLLSDIAGRSRSAWHTLFSLLVSFAFGALSILHYLSGDGEGFVVYGFVSLLTLLKTFVRFDGVLVFTVCAIGLTLSLPVAMVALPGAMAAVIMPFLGTIDSTFFFAGWFIFSGIVVLVTLWGYIKARYVFWVVVAVTSIFLGGSALIYGQEMYWGRAFVLLIAALVAVFVPIWDRFEFTSRRDRKAVFGTFGAVLALFVITIIIVRFVQTAVVTFAHGELASKAAYAKTTIESTLESVVTTVENGALNGQLVTAVENGKIVDSATAKKTTGKQAVAPATSVLDVIRTMFETRGNIRRIGVFDTQGELLSVYPYEPAMTGSYALRDFFTVPVTTGRVYVSDYFTDSVDKSAVVVSAPVLSKNGITLGVLVAWMDIAGLGTKLGQLVSAPNGEYVVMVDNAGRFMVNPNHALLYKQADPTDDVRLALSHAGNGITEGRDSSRVRMLTAYEYIIDRKWAVAIRMPVSFVVKKTGASVITIALVSLGAIAVVFITLLKRKIIIPQGDGP